MRESGLIFGDGLFNLLSDDTKLVGFENVPVMIGQFHDAPPAHEGPVVLASKCNDFRRMNRTIGVRSIEFNANV